MMLPIWITTLPRLENWQRIYDQLVEQTEEHKKHPNGNNFLITTNIEVWNTLYNQCLKKASEILGPFDVLESNKSSCWCYPSNNTYYRSGIHDHTRTSVINAVYYFSVPETSNYRDGAIAFYDANNTEIWAYKPREHDLLLFPNYLKHQPLSITSETYRFAINMEIICTTPAQFTCVGN